VAFFLILALFVTKRTAFGLFVESVGVNSTSSQFSGIKVDAIKLIIYTFSGIMAAMAGMIESAGIKGADCNNAGLMIEMDAILAVAIGGTSLSGGRFSIPASVVGALIIQSISTSLLAMGIAPQAIQVVKAVVVIVICLSQSKAFRNDIVSIFKRQAVSA
ncbi:MAG: ABC transporter permease, partial [Clostridiales bacterium]|nr:ABC transporter permease [Clostridiales bacterium]